MSKTIRMMVVFDINEEMAEEFFDVAPTTKEEWVEFLTNASQEQFANDYRDPIVQVVDFNEGTTTDVVSIADAVDVAGWVKAEVA